MIIGENLFLHDCTENDNHLEVVLNDGALDEIHVGDELNEERIIIGAEDLKAALAKAGFMIVTKEFIEKLDKEEESRAEWECDRTGYYPNYSKPSEDPLIHTKSK